MEALPIFTSRVHTFLVSATDGLILEQASDQGTDFGEANVLSLEGLCNSFDSERARYRRAGESGGRPLFGIRTSERLEWATLCQGLRRPTISLADFFSVQLYSGPASGGARRCREKFLEGLSCGGQPSDRRLVLPFQRS